MTDCSIPGKWDPALPVCLWGGVPSFFHAVVWQQRDEDWAHYYKLLIGKIYPCDFEGFSHFHLCTWGFIFMYIHSCVVATVVVNMSVLRDHGFHPRWKQWKEVSVLWVFSIKRKGCCSTGGGGEELELNMPAINFYSQLLAFLCNSRELGSGSPHRGCELLRTGGNSTG